MYGCIIMVPWTLCRFFGPPCIFAVRNRNQTSVHIAALWSLVYQFYNPIAIFLQPKDNSFCLKIFYFQKIAQQLSARCAELTSYYSCSAFAQAALPIRAPWLETVKLATWIRLNQRRNISFFCKWDIHPLFTLSEKRRDLRCLQSKIRDKCQAK